MADLKVEDIRAMSPDQMDEAVLNLKKERFNLRFQRATGQLENTSRLREARRDIARIKTIAAQKRAARNSTRSPTAWPWICAKRSKSPGRNPALWQSTTPRWTSFQIRTRKPSCPTTRKV